MKTARIVLSIVVVVGMLFAPTIPACAIGFDAEAAYESVFVICSGNSMGSGFAIGENCIVTNAHVIANKSSITVLTYGGMEYTATLCGIDEYLDIAVLAVKDARFPSLCLAEPSSMKIGDDIYAIGAPKGMAYTLTKGGISAKDREVGGQTYIQIDAAINNGNSGGPLLNDKGQVLGINTLKMKNSEGIGLAIPIDRVCEYLISLGIKVNDAGNVAGRVDVAEAETEDNELPGNTVRDDSKKDSEKDNQADVKGMDAITYVLILIAVASIIGNCVMVVLLKRKNKQPSITPYDPRERTDFEIDILE